MAEFDHSKVKVIDRYFSFLEDSRQTALIDVLRVKIDSAVWAAPPSKSVKSLKQRKNPNMLGICTSLPENFSRKHILIDFLSG